MSVNGRNTKKKHQLTSLIPSHAPTSPALASAVERPIRRAGSERRHERRVTNFNLERNHLRSRSSNTTATSTIHVKNQPYLVTIASNTFPLSTPSRWISSMITRPTLRTYSRVAHDLKFSNNKSHLTHSCYDSLLRMMYSRNIDSSNVLLKKPNN